MIQGVLRKIFGSRNERLLKQYGRIVREINALEAEISRLSDDALQAKTDEFRRRFQEQVAKAVPAVNADDADAETPTAAATTETAAERHEARLERARRDALEDL